jgi:glycosyltransferase involved in cell wall biosynthesis
MRILLFDWYSGGHHAGYLARFTRVLSADHEVVVCAPPSDLAAAEAAGATVDPIDETFPLADTSSRLSRARRAALREEIDLLRARVRRHDADHAVHMFADGVLRGLVGRDVGAPLTALLFRPRWDFAHGGRERGMALVYETAVAAWRRGRGAHSLLTLDPVAARRWGRLGGAPAFHLPEPPVEEPAPTAAVRSGVAMFGSLAPRKGIEHAARALEGYAEPVRFVLAGSVADGYGPELDSLAATMRRAAVDVDLRARPHDEAQGLQVLAGARAVLLPYVGHVGMSRVLLEAAVAGTPVVAHEDGLLGHLVRTRGLGLAVDCRDPSAFAAAIGQLVDDETAVDRHAPALAEFAAEHSPERFAAALCAPFRRG